MANFHIKEDMSSFTFTRRTFITGLAATALVKPAQADDADDFSLTTPAKPVPDIPFRDETGRIWQLSDYRGKVLILNIWATWCPPCIAEMPSLDRLSQQLGGADFAVLPISMDRGGAKAVSTFYQTNKLTHLPILLDHQAAINRFIKPKGLPFSLLVNRQGEEIAQVLGGITWDSPSVVRMIRRKISI